MGIGMEGEEKMERRKGEKGKKARIEIGRG